MNSVHPIVDETIVQINENEFLNHQIKQNSFELNHEEDRKDNEETNYSIEIINESIETIDDQRIDLENSVSNENEISNQLINNTNLLDNRNSIDIENNVNENRIHSIDHVVATNEDSESIISHPNVKPNLKKRITVSSESSIVSSSSSQDSTSNSPINENTDDKQFFNTKFEGNNLLERTQTIFEPILNGLNISKNDNKPQKQIEKEKFTFTWSNLSYFVYVSSRFGMKKKKKFIFDKINGKLKSNQLFGLLGPSGAGKSSLLDCLSFKRIKNISGEIKINGKFKKYKMCYIPQHDEYFEDLTCLEILTYASKLKNGSSSVEDTLLTLKTDSTDQMNQRKLSNRFQNFHEKVAKNVLNLLGLTEQCNTYAGRLSGGQKKRLSIASELVIKPHIIFLDEPTSGLDSSSSYQCISLLSQLAKQETPIAIVCTIHQPNPKTFQLFDQIYVLSNNGRCMYNASPFDVVSRLHQEEINIPIHYNPADYLLELASGEYDKSCIEKLVDQVKRSELNAKNQQLNNDDESKDARQAFEMFTYGKFIPQFKTLLNRCFTLTMRNPMLTTNRILSHLLLAVFIGWVFGPDVGKHSDCPAKMSLVLDADELNKLTNHTIENSKNVMDNMSSVFFGILVMLLGSLMPTLVTFPLEVKILQKETHNGWYSVGPYFYARLIADLPLQILVPFMYVSITYLLNGQLMEEFRFINFSLIFILTAVIAQCHGIIVSAIFSKDIMTAVYLGPITALPLLLFSGFLVRIERMPWIIRPFTYLSYMRFSFEGIIISIYGFNRCGDEAVEQIQSVRKQLDSYFTSIMSFVEAGINCEEDWDKANIRMIDNNLTSISHSDLRFNLSSLKESIETINESTTQNLLLQSEPENKTENGLQSLFNNLLDVMFNSELDENGHIVPRVMQIFDLKDAFLYRSIFSLFIFTFVTRIMSYYIIKYKANLRE